jgi:hypothetical protein
VRQVLQEQQQELHQQAFAQLQEQQEQQLFLLSYRKQQHQEPKSWLREVTSAFSNFLKVQK